MKTPSSFETSVDRFLVNDQRDAHFFCIYLYF